mgnify:CR=1 FL=1
MRRILLSPTDAVQIASEAIQWLDNYRGVVLNQPAAFGQTYDEQQHDQPTEDEDDAHQEVPPTPSARVPRYRVTRPIRGARQSTSSIPDRLPSPITPPFKPVHQPHADPEPQPEP